jgi:hypothetical protein
MHIHPPPTKLGDQLVRNYGKDSDPAIKNAPLLGKNGDERPIKDDHDARAKP